MIELVSLNSQHLKRVMSAAEKMNAAVLCFLHQAGSGLSPFLEQEPCWASASKRFASVGTYRTKWEQTLSFHGERQQVLQSPSAFVRVSADGELFLLAEALLVSSAAAAGVHQSV